MFYFSFQKSQKQRTETILLFDRALNVRQITITVNAVDTVTGHY